MPLVVPQLRRYGFVRVMSLQNHRYCVVSAVSALVSMLLALLLQTPLLRTSEFLKTRKLGKARILRWPGPPPRERGLSASNRAAAYLRRLPRGPARVNWFGV
jgi:hypothetical protein